MSELHKGRAASPRPPQVGTARRVVREHGAFGETARRETEGAVNMSELHKGRAASPRPSQVGTARRVVREHGAFGEHALTGRDRSPSGPSDGGFGERALPVRKKLPHEIPPWVEWGAVFFITVCSKPRGQNSLCHGEAPTRLWESILRRREMGQWWPHLILVMPDHLHALMSFATVPGMRKAMSDWKHFTGCSLGIEWQRDFFDHRLRHDESFVEKAHYIRMNPVRAGLVAKPDDWPHVWTMNGGFGETALPGRDASPRRPKGITP